MSDNKNVDHKTVDLLAEIDAIEKKLPVMAKVFATPIISFVRVVAKRLLDVEAKLKTLEGGK